MTYIAKDKEDFNTFISKLELPDYLQKYRNAIQPTFNENQNYGIAASKVLDFYRLFTSARAALIFAKQDKYDDNIISLSSGEFGQKWLRSEYLKNAIVWYNSCEDYIYQIIWFAYGLHGKGKIRNKKVYKYVLGKCNYSKIKDKQIGNLNSIIDNYRNDPIVNTLRQTLANNLKHRGGLEFKEFYDELYSDGVGEVALIKPYIISFDETLNILKEVHIKLLKFLREVLKFLQLKDKCTFSYPINFIK